MSDAGDIITGVLAAAETASAGIATSIEASSIEGLSEEDFPRVHVLHTDYAMTVLDWLQEERTWTVGGEFYLYNSTREAMQTLLEAFRDAVHADRTLIGVCQDAGAYVAVPDSHPDSAVVAGEYIVQAVKVVT